MKEISSFTHTCCVCIYVCVVSDMITQINTFDIEWMTVTFVYGAKIAVTTFSTVVYYYIL